MNESRVCELVTGMPIEKVVVIDTETTGTSPYDDEILSIAACDAFGNELFRSMVRPTRHTSWTEAQKINGISPRMVRNAPTIREIAETVRDLLMSDKLVVGYNLEFDLGFLYQHKVIENFPMATFDVMRSYARHYGTRRSHYGDGYMYSKLTDCARHYGYKFRAHDAMGDAKATAWCFRSLLSDKAFLSPAIDEVIDRLSRITMTQTKATASSIAELIDSGIISDQNAELKLGEVTRGKNKGEPRYECHVGGRCVGVATLGDTENILMLQAGKGGGDLPASVPCKAWLAKAGDSVRCTIEVTACDGLKRETLSSASRTRDELAEMRRKQISVPTPAPVQAPIRPRPIDSERAAEERALKKQILRDERASESSLIEFLLCLFLGLFGAHKFYRGNWKMGLVYFFTVGLFVVGWIYDCVKIGISCFGGKRG